MTLSLSLRFIQVRISGLKKYAAYREDAHKLPKQFDKRRWEYYKKNKGFHKQLEEKYTEMTKRKGPDNQKRMKSVVETKGQKKHRERVSKKRKLAEAEGGSSQSEGWVPKKKKIDAETPARVEKVQTPKKHTAEKNWGDKKSKSEIFAERKNAKEKAKITGLSEGRLATYTNSNKRLKN